MSPRTNVIRGLLARATTPLLPDDYLHLINPLWSARELRGRIVDVRRETADSATVTIETGWGFSHEYAAGQYVGIGLMVGGRWHWRSYSLTSIGDPDDKRISITVKATRDGFLSSHLVDGVEPGTVVRLAAPRGDFRLPDPPPGKILFLTAGSGITPVMAMLRSLRREMSERDGATVEDGATVDIVHIHSAPTRDDAIFLDELEQLAAQWPSYRLTLHLTSSAGKLDPESLGEDVADLADRQCWACGPAKFLDALEKLFDHEGLEEQLHVERFAIARTDHGGEGGRLTFSVSDKSIDIDGATTILEAGESLGVQLPFGCRMGICQTCVVPLATGYVRDLRTGEERREGERIQTCISTVSGECSIDM
ncbi:NADPH oxidoreductase [Gordonia jinhuaensis]|uniref:NADPH oxidoreductase n=1 Tax=Gordonia jinhuaensis TaxID=1517702 RepID=A0A916TGM3_9ACTN|nr:NADPH oxidoreductase [Gordonia jinhuaensis]